MAFFRPSSVRSMPQYSHMMWPSSLWNESTVREPSMLSSVLIRSFTALTASTTAGSSKATFGNGAPAR